MKDQTKQRAAVGADAAQHRRRMLLALSLLLTALSVMLIKDRSFWFGADETSAGDQTSSTVEPPVAWVPDQTTQAVQPTPVPNTAVRKHETSKHGPEPAAAGTSIVATERGVLAPLEVEVVNGKTHRTVQPDASAVKVDMQSDGTARELAPVSNAVQRTRVDAEKPQTSQPSYPSLAGQMKVQGSVLLQALIGADGIIQEVRVISGPAILSSAAREAAMQWRFKPYFQNGKPVDTQARITVNFVIKVWDDEARDHQAVGKTTPPTQIAHPGE
jgi:TonB family protein